MLLLALLAFLVACAVKTATPPQIERYILPSSVPDTAYVCLEFPATYACINVHDLRLLIASLRKS